MKLFTMKEMTYLMRTVIYLTAKNAISTLFRFFFLATPYGMRDLSSPASDQTHAPCSGSVES